MEVHLYVQCLKTVFTSVYYALPLIRFLDMVRVEGFRRLHMTINVLCCDCDCAFCSNPRLGAPLSTYGTTRIAPVAVDQCAVEETAPQSKSCNEEACGEFRWDALAWGPCSAACGGGLQLRQVGSSGTVMV